MISHGENVRVIAQGAGEGSRRDDLAEVTYARLCPEGGRQPDKLATFHGSTGRKTALQFHGYASANTKASG
ncbi:hypothetical protein D3C84_1189290 [compost metagenome]